MKKYLALMSIMTLVGGVEFGTTTKPRTSRISDKDLESYRKRKDQRNKKLRANRIISNQGVKEFKYYTSKDGKPFTLTILARNEKNALRKFNNLQTA